MQTTLSRFTPFIERLQRNVGRFYALLKQVTGAQKERALQGKDAKDTETERDILRASVVFLHAGFDDYLREIAKLVVGLYTSEVLNEIPLCGGANRATKFSLGNLASHKGLSVNEVITRSVREHFQKRSFNKREDLLDLLTQLRIDRADFEPFFSDTDWLMTWRHRIVHQADCDEDGSHSPIEFGGKDVQRLIRRGSTITMFASFLNAHLAPDGLREKLLQHARMSPLGEHAKR